MVGSKATGTPEEGLRRTGLDNLWLNSQLGGLGRSILLAKTHCRFGGPGSLGLVARRSLPHQGKCPLQHLVTLVSQRTIVSRATLGDWGWLPGLFS